MSDRITVKGKTLVRVFYTAAGEQERRAHEDFFAQHGAQCDGDYFHYVEPEQLYRQAMGLPGQRSEHDAFIGRLKAA